ncbi:hypothetical protein JCM10550A_01400 [Methanogenium cariaci]
MGEGGAKGEAAHKFFKVVSFCEHHYFTAEVTNRALHAEVMSGFINKRAKSYSLNDAFY